MKATIEVNAAEKIHNIMKLFGEKSITLHNANPDDIKVLLGKAGTKIASVNFHRRSDNRLRKMCYRLHVTNPSYASKPKGKGKGNRSAINERNTQMTVFDVNKVCRDRSGNIKLCDNGKQMRGAWRTIPLEKVTRIRVDGITYNIVK